MSWCSPGSSSCQQSWWSGTRVQSSRSLAKAIVVPSGRPRRPAVRSAGVGEPGRLTAGEVGDEDVVVAPDVAHERDPGAIRGERRVLDPPVDGQTSQVAAIRAHDVATECAPLAVGVEDDPLPVARPVRSPVVGGVVGQVPGTGAVGAHDVDLVVLVDAAPRVAVHDELAVRGPCAIELGSRLHRQVHARWCRPGAWRRRPRNRRTRCVLGGRRRRSARRRRPGSGHAPRFGPAPTSAAAGRLPTSGHSTRRMARSSC